RDPATARGYVAPAVRFGDRGGRLLLGAHRPGDGVELHGAGVRGVSPAGDVGRCADGSGFRGPAHLLRSADREEVRWLDNVRLRRTAAGRSGCRASPGGRVTRVRPSSTA